MQKDTYTHFVGIDISKITFDYAIYKEATILHSGQVSNTKQGLNKLRKQLQKMNIGLEKVLFCCENTGVYTCPLLHFSADQKINLWIANAPAIKRSLGLVRGKSDAVDAQRIGLYAYRFVEEARWYAPPRPVVKQLEVLLGLRRSRLEGQGRLQRQLQENKKFDFLAHQAMVKMYRP